MLKKILIVVGVPFILFGAAAEENGSASSPGSPSRFRRMFSGVLGVSPFSAAGSPMASRRVSGEESESSPGSPFLRRAQWATKVVGALGVSNEDAIRSYLQYIPEDLMKEFEVAAVSISNRLSPLKAKKTREPQVDQVTIYISGLRDVFLRFQKRRHLLREFEQKLLEEFAARVDLSTGHVSPEQLDARFFPDLLAHATEEVLRKATSLEGQKWEDHMTILGVSEDIDGLSHEGLTSLLKEFPENRREWLMTMGRKYFTDRAPLNSHKMLEYLLRMPEENQGPVEGVFAVLLNDSFSENKDSQGLYLQKFMKLPQHSIKPFHLVMQELGEELTPAIADILIRPFNQENLDAAMFSFDIRKEIAARKMAGARIDEALVREIENRTEKRILQWV